MKRYFPTAGRHAFTLVELLVVIGIIALLISILLPTLGRARDSANSVKCQSNLRQIGVGVIFYADDHNGFVVPAEDPNAMNAPHWAAILIQTGSLEGDTADPNSANDDSDLENVYRCPEGIAKNWALAGFQQPTSHEDGINKFYWLRSTAEGRQVPLWYGANAGKGRSSGNRDMRGFWPVGHGNFEFFNAATNAAETTFYASKLTRIRNATKMAMFFDGLQYHDMWGFKISTRHGDSTKANVLHADGHVEAYVSSELPDNSFPFEFPATLTLKFPKLNWHLDQE